MEDILVIGGGFAGFWSAAAAARLRQQNRADLKITLVSPGDDLVMRPRLYEAEPDKLSLPLDRLLSPIKVKRVRATVTDIDVVAGTVSTRDSEGREGVLNYRKLVLAAGSQVRRPMIPGAEYLHDVDTMTSAVALDRHLQRLEKGPGRFTAVVVGAGFTGLEIATELVGRLNTVAARFNAGDEVQVFLVERADVVGPDLGSGPRPVITAALATLGVRVHLDQSISSLTQDSVRLADGTEISAQTVIWTAGIAASPLTAAIGGRRDRIGRLYVDEFLNLPGAPNIYAAGDTAAAQAEEGNLVMPSCQHAIPMGKYAGYNVAADLLGINRVVFTTSPYATCLDLGPAGAVLTSGWDRVVQKVGVEAKEHKRRTNQQRIYPPLDNETEILRVANFSITTRQVAAA